MSHPIRVLSTLALKGAVHGLAGQYQTAGGARIDADFAPTLALLERLRSGESADVVILTREGLEEVVREGRVVAGSCVDLARSWVGIAVKAGAIHPDISTEAALRTALLDARSVAYSRLGASGIGKGHRNDKQGQRNTQTAHGNLHSVVFRAIDCEKGRYN